MFSGPMFRYEYRTATRKRRPFVMRVLFVAHTTLLAAALASPREIAEFGSWDWKIRYGIVLIGLAVMIATGAMAWMLTRRTLDRFDEWAGRPKLPLEPDQRNQREP